MATQDKEAVSQLVASDHGATAGWRWLREMAAMDDYQKTLDESRRALTDAFRKTHPDYAWALRDVTAPGLPSVTQIESLISARFAREADVVRELRELPDDRESSYDQLGDMRDRLELERAKFALWRKVAVARDASA